jgi:uncharacterized RDD family membrane protein YckC
MEDNVYKSPESDLKIDKEGEYELATRWNRLWAALVDGLTIIPIIVAVMYFTGGFDDLAEGIEPSITYNLFLSLISIVIFIAIHGKFMISAGQTLGKKALGIKMVTMDNQHVDISNLVKRYGFSWFVSLIPVVGQIISLVNILFIFTKSKRCLHDHVGNTKVVRVK